MQGSVFGWTMDLQERRTKERALKVRLGRRLRTQTGNKQDSKAKPIEQFQGKRPSGFSSVQPIAAQGQVHQARPGQQPQVSAMAKR